MPLQEVLKKFTNRQAKAILYWLREDLNKPGKEESYAMQIACEVRRAFSQNPQNIHLKDFKLKFTNDPQPGAGKLSPQELTARAKADWALRLKAAGANHARNRSGKTGGAANRGRKQVHRDDGGVGKSDQESRKDN